MTTKRRESFIGVIMKRMLYILGVFFISSALQAQEIKKLFAGDLIYMTKQEDTVEKIAAKFQTTPAAIYEANSLNSQRRLNEGERLIIPKYTKLTPKAFFQCAGMNNEGNPIHVLIDIPDRLINFNGAIYKFRHFSDGKLSGYTFRAGFNVFIFNFSPEKPSETLLFLHINAINEKISPYTGFSCQTID